MKTINITNTGYELVETEPDTSVKNLTDVRLVEPGQDETKIKRMSPESIDEQYMQVYLDNPELSKVETLRRAGHPNPTRQRAWEIHNRLAEQIDKQLDRLIMQDAALGRSVLVDLAKHSSSESVRAASAAKLMEYAGKQRPDRLIVENRTPEDIDSEIALVQKRILEAQGDTPEGELH